MSNMLKMKVQFIVWIASLVVNVQSASHTFNLKNDYDSFSRFIASLVSVHETKPCQFKCDEGEEPEPMPGHKPTSDGCIPLLSQVKGDHYQVDYQMRNLNLQLNLYQLDTSTLPQMAECCDTHDKCYHTCNKEKLECDKTFKKCLEKMCKGLKHFLNEDESKACQATAMVMYAEAYTVGCERYIDSQKKACACKREKTEL